MIAWLPWPYPYSATYTGTGRSEESSASRLPWDLRVDLSLTPGGSDPECLGRAYKYEASKRSDLRFCGIVAGQSTW
jgi:hypothetical protein